MKLKGKLKITSMIVFSALLIVFDLSFIISSFAKYITGLPGTQSTKTVAKWDVSANLPNTSINLSASDEENTYTLTVTNDSEVSTKYSISVSNIPAGVLVGLDSGAYKYSTGSVTFNNVGTINANASTKTKTHIIKFKAIPEAAEVSNRNVKIQVTFNQVNPQ